MKQHVYCLIGTCVCVMFSLFAFLHGDIGMQTGWIVCIVWTLIAARHAERVDELEQNNSKLCDFIMRYQNKEIFDVVQSTDPRIDDNEVLKAIKYVVCGS